MTGPPELDCRELVSAADRRGILIEPGDVHFVSPTPPLHHFRLGFSAAPQDVIEPGIRLLGRVCRELGVGADGPRR